MREPTAIARATVAATQLREPMIMRCNQDRTWWWFERASWALMHPEIVKNIQYLVMPDGKIEFLGKEPSNVVPFPNSEGA